MEKIKKQKNVYRQFGARLKGIAEKNYSPDKSVESNLSEIFGYDKAAIYSWFRGEIDGNKPLTYSAFKGFLLKYLGKSHLDSDIKLEYFLNCGPTRLLKVLDAPDILDKISKLKSEKKFRDLQIIEKPDGISRKHLEFEVLEKMKKNTTTVIVGAPGLGKKFLMKQIAWNKFVELEQDEIIWIADSEEAKTETQALDLIERALKPFEKPNNLNYSFTTGQFLYCVENVTNPYLIPALLNKLKHVKPENFRILVTTSYTTILTYIEIEYELLKMPKFSLNEVYAFARFLDPKFNNRLILRTIAKKIGLNPLGLAICLKLAKSHGLVGILSMLEKSSLDLNNEYEWEIVRPLRLAYRLLSQNSQLRVVQLGALPYLKGYQKNVFASTWEVSTEEIDGYMISLLSSGLIESTPSGTYTIHEQTLKFVRELFKELDLKNQKRVLLWRDRGISEKTIKIRHEKNRKSIYRPYFQEVKSDINEYPREHFFVSALKRLIVPWRHTFTQWKLIQTYSSNFDSDQYLQAYYLYRQEKSWSYATWVIVWSSVIILFIPDAPVNPKFSTHYLYSISIWLKATWIILMMLFTLNWATKHYAYLMMWRRLWNGRLEKLD